MKSNVCGESLDMEYNEIQNQAGFWLVSAPVMHKRRPVMPEASVPNRMEKIPDKLEERTKWQYLIHMHDKPIISSEILSVFIKIKAH